MRGKLMFIFVLALEKSGPFLFTDRQEVVPRPFRNDCFGGPSSEWEFYRIPLGCRTSGCGTAPRSSVVVQASVKQHVTRLMVQEFQKP